MSSNCVFHYCKAKTSAAKFATAALVDAVEALKKMVQVLRFYARTIVADLELVEMTAFEFCLFADNGQTRGTCGVCNDIVNEIAEDTIEQACIAENFYMARHLK